MNGASDAAGGFGGRLVEMAVYDPNHGWNHQRRVPVLERLAEGCLSSRVTDR